MPVYDASHAILSLSPAGTGNASSSIPSGSFADALAQVSITDEGAKEINNLILRTVMGSRLTVSPDGGYSVDEDFIGEVLVNNEKAQQLVHAVASGPRPAEFADKLFDIITEVTNELATQVFSEAKAPLQRLSDGVVEVMAKGSHTTDDKSELSVEYRERVAALEAAEDKYVRDLRDQDVLLRKVKALLAKAATESDPATQHKLENYATQGELKLHQSANDSGVKGTGKMELNFTEEAIVTMGYEKWGREVLKFLGDHPKMHALVPFWKYIVLSYDYVTQLFYCPPRLNRSGAETLNAIEYCAEGNNVPKSLSNAFVCAYEDGSRYLDSKLEQGFSATLFARLKRSECFGVEKVEEAPVVGDGFNKLWRTLQIARAVDPKQHSKAMEALTAAIAMFSSGGVLDACSALNDALDMYKQLDLKVGWFACGKIVREEILSRTDTSSKFVTIGSADFSDAKAAAADGGYQDSAAFTRAMLAKIATIPEKEGKKVRRVGHTQERGKIDPNRTECMVPDCKNRVQKALRTQLPYKICDGCHRKGHEDKKESIRLQDGSFFTFGPRKDRSEAPEGGIKKMRERKQEGSAEPKSKKEKAAKLKDKRKAKRLRERDALKLGKEALKKAKADSEKKSPAPDSDEKYDSLVKRIRDSLMQEMDSEREDSEEKPAKRAKSDAKLRKMAAQRGAFRSLEEEFDLEGEDAGDY